MSERHPGRPKKTDYGSCKMEGCLNTTEDSAFGFCRPHYMAYRRGQINKDGQALYEPKRIRSYGSGARCTVPGCGNRPKGLGLCATHYQQHNNGVDLGVPVPDRGFTKEQTSYTGIPCLVVGCLERPVNKGLCNKHTMQRRAGIVDELGNALREIMPTGRKRERDRWVSSTRDGYILRVAPPGHPHARSDGTILEHRLMMEDHLGRYLEEWEIVHHKDGVRSHNVLANLELYDGRAKREDGPGHHPGHSIDTRTAAQAVLQGVRDAAPKSVIEFLEGILNKGTN